jgi:hypothetical protein
LAAVEDASGEKMPAPMPATALDNNSTGREDDVIVRILPKVNKPKPVSNPSLVDRRAASGDSVGALTAYAAVKIAIPRQTDACGT